MDVTAVKAWLFNPTVGKIVAAIVAVILARGLAIALSSSVLGRIHDTTARYRARKMVALVSYLVAGVVITVIFSDKLGGLTVAFGVAGAGIAFALQEVIASLAGWVAVMFGGFYRIGDRVQLGGIRGDVIDIGVIRTTIMEIGEWVKGDLYTGRIVRVANSFVFKEPVFNYSGDFPFLWDEIIVPIKFGSDYAEARKILQDIATEHLGDYATRARSTWEAMVTKYAIEDAQIDPMVTVVANDNWVEFTLRYVVDHKRRRGTKDVLWTAALAAFDATEGRVGMASMTVHLVETPTFDVRMLPQRAS
ncbi:hypothetical protein DB30_05781 [Enhygromyxa salina]|uniref:Mechanosensitive ion channel MscS domain-containing protein n=1 Tax=Enhygromyxa salina TaxID=215803 RepID=A0A0C2D5E4_9BACT|nr:mechanosensitive ion channel domain-containing protein [Enhygromyxa salina]KIG15237.1 hypothetical protein DB30_05781 [Enhygromyxa salina]